VSKTEYLLHVSAAGSAAELHEISRMAAADPALTPADYITVRGEVGKRFSALNAQTVGTPAPRWSAPVRIPTAVHAK
jgi:hypothetical protein